MCSHDPIFRTNKESSIWRQNDHRDQGFPWAVYTWGGQSVNGGGTHEGGHRPYGGELTLIDCIIN